MLIWFPSEEEGRSRRLRIWKRDLGSLQPPVGFPLSDFKSEYITAAMIQLTPAHQGAQKPSRGLKSPPGGSNSPRGPLLLQFLSTTCFICDFIILSPPFSPFAEKNGCKWRKSWALSTLELHQGGLSRSGSEWFGQKVDTLFVLPPQILSRDEQNSLTAPYRFSLFVFDTNHYVFNAII